MRRPSTRIAIAVALISGLGWSAAHADAQAALADFKAGRYLEAAAEIQAVVDRSPGYAYGYFLLGHCMLKMQRSADAELEFRRALRLDPTRAEYYQGVALALNASGNWAGAVRAATEGLARARDVRARYALLTLRGYAWGAQRRWIEAVRDLEAARLIRPETWVLAFLGRARFAIGAYASAIPPLLEVLPSVPDDPTVLRLLAESYLRLAGNETDPARKALAYGESLTYAQRLVSARPGDLGAVHLLGRTALGAGRLAQAENIFRHVLANDPRQCYAMVDLGRTYMGAARWAEAEAFLRNASACAPRMATIYESLGDLYLRLGKPEKAAAAFRHAEGIEPSQPAGERDATIPVSSPR